MAEFTVEKMLEAGLAPSMNAANGGGDTFKNAKSNVVILAVNDDVSSTNITITAQRTTKQVSGYGEMTKADQVVAVPANSQKIIGAFPRKAFNNSSELVALSYSSVTSLTIAVMEMEALE